MKNNWYLIYTEDITEDVYNRLIAKLLSIGMTQRNHAELGTTYNSFKESKHLRHDHSPRSQFVIDNNCNGTTEEIFVRDVLGEESKPSIPLSTNGEWKAGDRVVPKGSYSSRGKGIVIAMAANNRSFLVEHDALANGHNGGGTTLEWGRMAIGNRGWFYSLGELESARNVPIESSFEYVTAIGSSEYVKEGKIYKCALGGTFKQERFTILKDETGTTLTPACSFEHLRLSTAEEIIAAKAGYSTLREFHDAASAIKQPKPVVPAYESVFPRIKFSIGDKVIGNLKANSHYSTSREGWKGVVTEVMGDKIRVEGTGMSSGALPVLSECFDLYIEPVIDKREIWDKMQEGLYKRPVPKSPIPSRVEEKYMQEPIIIKQPKKAKIIVI